jgi:hypothetical protein
MAEPVPPDTQEAMKELSELVRLRKALKRIRRLYEAEKRSRYGSPTYDIAVAALRGETDGRPATEYDHKMLQDYNRWLEECERALAASRDREGRLSDVLRVLLEWAAHPEGEAPSGIRRTEALAQALVALSASKTSEEDS